MVVSGITETLIGPQLFPQRSDLLQVLLHESLLRASLDLYSGPLLQPPLEVTLHFFL